MQMPIQKYVASIAVPTPLPTSPLPSLSPPTRKATICCKLSCVGATPSTPNPNPCPNPYPNPNLSHNQFPSPAPFPLPTWNAPLCLLAMRGKLIFQLQPHSCRLPVPVPSPSPIPTPRCLFLCRLSCAHFDIHNLWRVLRNTPCVMFLNRTTCF